MMPFAQTRILNPSELTDFKFEVLNRFMLLNGAAILGSIATLALLPVSALLNPVFFLGCAIFWVIASFSYFNQIVRNKQKVPASFDGAYGVLTGVFLSSVIAAQLLINPITLVFALATTGLIVLSCFLYAHASNQESLLGLQRDSLLRSFGLTAFSFSFISLGLVLTGILAGAPVFVFVDAILCGILAGAGLVSTMHYVLKEVRNDSLPPSYYSAKLFIDTVDLFINILRAMNAAQDDRSFNQALPWQAIVRIAIFVSGTLLLLKTLLTGELFDFTAGNQSRRAKDIPANGHYTAGNNDANRAPAPTPNYGF
jgi:hypothetical protein